MRLIQKLDSSAKIKLKKQFKKVSSLIIAGVLAVNSLGGVDKELKVYAVELPYSEVDVLSEGYMVELDDLLSNEVVTVNDLWKEHYMSGGTKYTKEYLQELEDKDFHDYKEEHITGFLTKKNNSIDLSKYELSGRSSDLKIKDINANKEVDLFEFIKLGKSSVYADMLGGGRQVVINFIEKINEDYSYDKSSSNNDLFLKEKVVLSEEVKVALKATHSGEMSSVVISVSDERFSYISMNKLSDEFNFGMSGESEDFKTLLMMFVFLHEYSHIDGVNAIEEILKDIENGKYEDYERSEKEDLIDKLCNLKHEAESKADKFATMMMGKYLSQKYSDDDGKYIFELLISKIKTIRKNTSVFDSESISRAHYTEVGLASTLNLVKDNWSDIRNVSTASMHDLLLDIHNSLNRISNINDVEKRRDLASDNNGNEWRTNKFVRYVSKEFTKEYLEKTKNNLSSYANGLGTTVKTEGINFKAKI